MADEYVFFIGLGAGLAVGVVLGWLYGQSQSQALHKQIEQQRQRIAQVDALVSGMRRKLADAEAQLRQVEQARQPATGAQTATEPSSWRVRQLEDDLAQARQQAGRLESQLSALQGRLPQLESDVVEARQRAAAAEAASRQAIEQMQAAQAQAEQAAARANQLERELGAGRQADQPETPKEQRPAHATVPPFLDRPAVEPAGGPSPSKAAPVEPELEAPTEKIEPPLPAEPVTAYCVRCRVKRPMLNPQETLTSNGRAALQDVCPECGAKLFRFVKG